MSKLTSELIGTPVDVSELIDVFQADEGEIQSLSGRIGNGKTYGATKLAIDDLLQGKVVYTNWHLILDEYEPDQRNQRPFVFWNFLFFRKRFYKIDIKKNWHFFDPDDSDTWVIRDKRYDDFIEFIADITDAVVYFDEGQDVFDSYEGTKMSKKKRKSLTRTRHLNKTLIIISQRPQAIAVTARANVNRFLRTKKVLTWPFIRFHIYATEEIDSQNMPIWDNHEYLYDKYNASARIFRTYNSWYLRAGIPKSQEVYFEAYDLTFKQRTWLLLMSFFPFLKKRKENIEEFENFSDTATNTTEQVSGNAPMEPLPVADTRVSGIRSITRENNKSNALSLGDSSRTYDTKEPERLNTVGSDGNLLLPF